MLQSEFSSSAIESSAKVKVATVLAEGGNIFVKMANAAFSESFTNFTELHLHVISGNAITSRLYVVFFTSEVHIETCKSVKVAM